MRFAFRWSPDPFNVEAFESISPSPHEMHRTLFTLDSMSQLERSAEAWVSRHELMKA